MGLLAYAVFANTAVAGDRAPADAIRPAQARSSTQLAQACSRIYRPVCAFADGRWLTFSNSCVARSRGVLLIRQGACRLDNRQRVCCLRAARYFNTTLSSCRGVGGRITAPRNCRASNSDRRAQPKSR